MAALPDAIGRAYWSSWRRQGCCIRQHANESCTRRCVAQTNVSLAFRFDFPNRFGGGYIMSFSLLSPAAARRTYVKLYGSLCVARRRRVRWALNQALKT